MIFAVRSRSEYAFSYCYNFKFLLECLSAGKSKHCGCTFGNLVCQSEEAVWAKEGKHTVYVT